jgi:hypothetical protein
VVGPAKSSNELSNYTLGKAQWAGVAVPVLTHCYRHTGKEPIGRRSSLLLPNFPPVDVHVLRQVCYLVEADFDIVQGVPLRPRV